MKYPAVIDAQKCIGCTQCKLICPVEAIRQQEVICQVNADECIKCGLCLGVCPVGCIEEVEGDANAVSYIEGSNF